MPAEFIDQLHLRREVTSFLLLSCQRCQCCWLVDYYPKWGVKWLLILPFSSLTICTGNLEWPPRLLRRARPAEPCLARPRRQCKVKTKKKAGKPSSSSVTTLTSCVSYNQTCLRRKTT